VIDPEEALLLWRASSSICYPSVMGETGKPCRPPLWVCEDGESWSKASCLNFQPLLLFFKLLPFF
jgi:hypothetical protein